MTGEAGFIVGYQFPAFELVTTGTGQVFHLGKSNLVLLVTCYAVSLLVFELVQFHRMTGGALHALLEPVHGVPGGAGDLRRLLVRIPMTANTKGTGNEDFFVRAPRNL